MNKCSANWCSQPAVWRVQHIETGDVTYVCADCARSFVASVGIAPLPEEQPEHIESSAYCNVCKASIDDGDLAAFMDDHRHPEGHG